MSSLSSMKNLTILGSTGSIGESTLDVVRRHPDRFMVHALTAHRQIEKLAQQCLEFKPRFAVVGFKEEVSRLKILLAGSSTQVLCGPEALIEVAGDNRVDTVMAAIVGAAGLMPTLTAAQTGKQVLLANKEALVMSGQLFMQAVANNGAVLLPIDSEHNAIFQCLPMISSGERYQSKGVEELLLTASGGPFLNTPLSELTSVTPDQACAHPNWVMGRKISVDSATMMNKGLELIEAHWLFNIPVQKIQVVIHPQSVIHSMVRYVDGSILAQLGQPDMRTPIAYGLGWPERIDAGVQQLSLDQMSHLSFEKPDIDRFPCLGLAIQAAAQGESAPTVLNAANEVAVQAFLDGQIKYLGISQLVTRVLDKMTLMKMESLEEILDIDRQARLLALQYLNSEGFSL
jgi:1-deoxy-D-xylulose-5-phosphate reductoisomerase